MPSDADKQGPPKRRRTAAPSDPPPTPKWFRRPSVVWYRGHDLRVEDHPALLAAAQRGGPVVPLFIWDAEDGFGSDLGYVKQWWLRESLIQLESDLRSLGVRLYARAGRSTDELRRFLNDTGADAVFWNRCYEPELLKRDEELREELAHEGLTAESFKAELLVEPWELSNSDSSPSFRTFRSYMRAWMTVSPPPHPFPWPSRLKLLSSEVESVGVRGLGLKIPNHVEQAMAATWCPGSAQAMRQLEKFLLEVFPAFGEERCRRHFEGTSRLSPHIRFGEISPRRLYHATRVRVSRSQAVVPSSLSALVALSREGSTPQCSEALCATDSIAAVPANAKDGGQAVRVPEGARELSIDGIKTMRPPQSVTLGAASREAQKQVLSEPRQPRAAENDGEPAGDNTGLSSSDSKRNHHSDMTQVGLPHISLSARAFLKNLCLRDFSYHVLYHHPDFNSRPLVPEFSRFPWAEDNGSFEAWKHGRTGYPIVDAAMRQLRTTGWVHNNMRFLLACFLTKYLLLPWQRGLREFYSILLDGDRSANALGWQWTSGSNTDAFPVSCLVNPGKIGTRHDPEGEYIRRWLPELTQLSSRYIHQPWKAPPDVLAKAGVTLGGNYPIRVVDSTQARHRAINAMLVMKQVFKGAKPSRGVSTAAVEDIMREWPGEEEEYEQLDDNGVLGGKLSLIPSLWSVLQCDQPPASLAGGPGTEPLTGTETASLVEGALAMSHFDQHESMENAMISAHEQGSGDATSIADTPNLRAGGEVLSKHLSASGEDVEQRNAKPSPNDGSPNLSHMPRGAPLPSTAASFVAHPPPPVAPAPAIHQHHHPPQVPTGSPTQPNSVPVQTRQPTPTFAQHPSLHPQHLQQLQQLQQLQHLQQLQLQQQQQHPHPMMEGLYAPSGVAGVPMTNFPVMMGPAANSGELSGSPNVNANDMNSFYAHQFSLGQLYGFPHMMPLMNSQGAAANNGGRADMTAVASAAMQQQLSMPGMFPMGYGLYGGPGFDPNLFGYPQQSAGGSQAPAVSGASQPHYPPSNQHMYMPAPPAGSEMLPGQIQPQGVSNLGVSSQMNNLTAAVAAAAVAAGGMEVANNDESQSRVAAPREGNDNKSAPRVDTTSGGKGGVEQARQAQPRGTKSNAAAPASSLNNQGTAALGVRKSSGRVAKGGGTRARREGGSGKRTAAASGSVNAENGQPAGPPTTLKNRQDILASVLEKHDHEYYGFARYLMLTYELTGNTNRQTSKDYVRLCNLKDDYHKQCESDRDKLKIYRIKSFFSKILKLEVTGEWDRHNHGGIRGPYVYGLRDKRAQSSES